MYQELHMWDESIAVAEAAVSHLLYSCPSVSYNLHCWIVGPSRVGYIEDKLLSASNGHKSGGKSRRGWYFCSLFGVLDELVWFGQ